MNIAPSPRPIFKDETKDVVLERIPVENAKPNINIPHVQKEPGTLPNSATPQTLNKPLKVENVEEFKVIKPVNSSSKESSTGKEGALEPVSKPVSSGKEGALEPVSKPVYTEPKSKPVYSVPETKSSPQPVYVPPVSKPAPVSKPVNVPATNPVKTAPIPVPVPPIKRGGF